MERNRYSPVQCHALIISKDEDVVRQIKQLLTDVGVMVDALSDLSQARTLLATSRFETVIVDCDMPGVGELMQGIRDTVLFDRRLRIVAILGPVSEMRAVAAMQAMFVVTKPLDSATSMRTLRTCLAVASRERRQTSRRLSDLEVTLTYGAQAKTAVFRLKAMNITAGGMQVRAAVPLPLMKAALVRFVLPDGTIEAKADVLWSDSMGRAGILFRDLQRNDREALRQYAEGMPLHSHRRTPTNVNLRVPVIPRHQ